MINDLTFIIPFWLLLVLIGLSFWPLTATIFTSFPDGGWGLSKILGLAIISYLIWLTGSLHLLPFSTFGSWLVFSFLAVFNLFFLTRNRKELLDKIGSFWTLIVLEEGLYLLAFLFWAFVRAHEPSIHGLEKFMDFGFINSLLRTDFFPPKDLWLSPQTINYYYFGHLVTAVLIKLSQIPPEISYNLMLATIFALTFTGAFSIGLNLFNFSLIRAGSIVAGLLSAFLVTLGGNLHTLYTLTRGFNKYWYPDATRFIPYTIHEFPSYSWVVADLHGHVLDIPFVILTIAILFSLTSKFKVLQLLSFKFCLLSLLLGFMLAIMYMTNAWDGIIYFGLASLVLLYLNLNPGSASGKYHFQFSMFNIRIRLSTLSFLSSIFLIVLGFFLFSLPFNLNFKPFASGIHLVRDRSPLYMLTILWGFFYFFAMSFIVFLWEKKQNSNSISHPEFISGSRGMLKQVQHDSKKWLTTDYFILILIFLSTFLLIFPEVLYVKDIYPLHYRANTMFKLGYQAFIMLSLSSAYIILRITSSIRCQVLGLKKKMFSAGYLLLSAYLLILVFLYPYFSIKTYYNNLKEYQGLNGMSWFNTDYPSDYQAILWMRKNIKGQPVILEAVGESYTDYARVSSFTGLPTIIGWPVHEWLWRGSYNEAGKRVEEVKRAWETNSLLETSIFLQKYQVRYVFVGILEYQKYPGADFTKWESLGKAVFQSDETVIYQIP